MINNISSNQQLQQFKPIKAYNQKEDTHLNNLKQFALFAAKSVHTKSGTFVFNNVEPFSRQLDKLCTQAEICKEVNLDLSQLYTLSAKDLSLLMHKLSHNFTSLTKLSFNFGNTNNLDSNKLSTFAIGLKSLASLSGLQHLEIKFPKNLDADVKSFKAFAQKLKYFRNLSSLRLNFDTSKNLHSQNIQDLAHGLRDLNKLDTLDLNFNNCSLVENEAYIELAQNLNNLSNLIHLNLNISDCIDINDSVV